MQKTQWRSRTSCRQFWWLDNSRSQGSQWKLWISKPSPICSRGAGLGHPMDPVVPVQNQNFTSSWNLRGNLKSFTLTIPSNSAKLMKISPGIILRRHHTDQKLMVLRKEQCAEWKKARLLYCCNRVWMKVGGQILWNGIPIWETLKISCLMGRDPILTDYPVWFTGWVSPCNCEGPVKNPSIWKESLTWIVLRIRSVRGEKLEGWHIGCRRWGFANEGLIRNLLKKTQCEGKNISQRKWKIQFSSRRWTNHTFCKRSGTENIHLYTGTSNTRRESRWISWRIRRVSSTTSRLVSGCCEAMNDFWSMSGNFIYRHHVEPRVKLYSPREESFPSPLKYIDVSRTTVTNLDIMQERRIDDFIEYRWVKRCVWFLDRFHSVYSKWETSRRILVVRGETDQNGKRHPDQIIYGQN